MAKTAILAVKIIGDSKDATQALDKTESRIGSFGKKAGAAVAGGLVAVTAAAGALAVQGVKAAGDLEQSIGAIDTVFKGSADQMHAWASTAAQDVGLTRDEFNGLGTIIGTQLKNGGTAMDELAPKTNNLIQLGADLSSMFGGTTADAVGALSSALKGERDPIEKYGVSLNQAAIDAKAAEMGFQKVGGALSAEANQAATLALIMEQTSDAHGNFARESETLAHKQQVFTASVKNLVAELGTALLPIATAVFGFLLDTAVPAVEKLVGAFTAAAEGGGLASKLGLDKLMPIIQTMGQVFASLIPVVRQVFFDTIVPAGQAIAANVIPVIQAIAGTVIPAFLGALRAIIPPVVSVISALLDFAVTISGRLMPIVQGLLPVVTTVFSAVSSVIGNVMNVVSGIIRTVTAVIKGDWSAAWDNIKTTVSSALDLIKSVITGGLNIIKSVVKAAWDAIKGIFRGAWTALTRTVSTGVDKVKNFMAGLPGKILSAVGDLSGLLANAGRQVIDGFIGAIGAGFKRVRNKFGELTSLIPKIKGPPAKDKTLLKGAGQLIITGFINGLESRYGAVRKSLGGLTKDVAATSFTAPTITATGYRRQATTSSSHRAPVVINVNGALDPTAVARQIRQLLSDYERLVTAT